MYLGIGYRVFFVQSSLSANALRVVSSFLA